MAAQKAEEILFEELKWLGWEETERDVSFCPQLQSRSMPHSRQLRLVDCGPERYFDLVAEEQRKLLQRVVRDGLKIQGRFSAAPVYAVTGRGHLQSEGVSTLQKIKRNLKQRREKSLAC